MSKLHLLSGAVEKRSLDRAAADALRQLIVGGAIEPGARLIEVQIASQMELSRGTIRAALQRLVAEGLVVLRPYTGWEVVTLSRQDVWELHTLRGTLEGLASSLAAANSRRKGAIEEAFDALKAAAKGKKHQALSDADFRFHLTVVELAGHGRLSAHYKLIEQQVRMFVASSNAFVENPRDVVANHEELVAALLKGDAAASELQARRHNQKSADLIIRHLDQMDAAVRKERTKAS